MQSILLYQYADYGLFQCFIIYQLITQFASQGMAQPEFLPQGFHKQTSTDGISRPKYQSSQIEIVDAGGYGIRNQCRKSDDLTLYCGTNYGINEFKLKKENDDFGGDVWVQPLDSFCSKFDEDCGSSPNYG